MTKSKVSKALIYPCIAALGLAYCSDRPTDITIDRVSSTSENTLSTTVYAPQNRPDVRGQIGAVSAGHPLAAQAGLRVLQDGGNATDAIIAMAGVLAVSDRT